MGRRVNGPSSPALEAVFYERPPIAHRFRADQLPFVSFRSGTLPCGSEGVCAGASPRRARTRTPREERRFCQPSRSVSPGDEEVRDVSSKERQVKGSALAATLGRRTSPSPHDRTLGRRGAPARRDADRLAQPCCSHLCGVQERGQRARGAKGRPLRELDVPRTAAGVAAVHSASVARVRVRPISEADVGRAPRRVSRRRRIRAAKETRWVRTRPSPAGQAAAAGRDRRWGRGRSAQAASHRPSVQDPVDRGGVEGNLPQ